MYMLCRLWFRIGNKAAPHRTTRNQIRSSKERPLVGYLDPFSRQIMQALLVSYSRTFDYSTAPQFFPLPYALMAGTGIEELRVLMAKVMSFKIDWLWRCF